MDSGRGAGIGVLGSAFNPPHLGHLALAQEALWQLGLDEVILVPTGEALEEDWASEYLGLKMAVAVVDSVADAVEHVNSHGTGHSEAIVTGSEEAAEEFVSGVDAAAVYVNASTRFTDGFEYGMGAEIGNSTQKLHARGPIGVRELCTFKYVVEGSGQVRP